MVRIRFTLTVLLSILVLWPVSCGKGAKKAAQPQDAYTLAEFSLSALAGPGGEVQYLPGKDNPLAEPCLRITPEGRITLPGNSTEFPWAKAVYLVLDVYHEAGVTGSVQLDFLEEAGKEPTLWCKLAVMPTLRTRLVFPIEALNAQEVFLRRTPGRLKGLVIGRKTRPELLSSVTVSLDSVVAGQSLFISRIRLTTEPPVTYPLEGPPQVDSLGQWATREWPGKTPNSAALFANLKADLDSAGQHSFPSEWSKFGGWKKLHFKATGFFRLEKTPARWWLVDPQGYAFYSVGVDGVGPVHTGCPTGMIESLFQWIPPQTGEFTPAWGSLWDGKTIDFVGVNLIRAFGGSWRRDWSRITRDRMHAWRVNTLGNWSDKDEIPGLAMPYVIPLGEFPGTDKTLFRDFPDVFDPSYLKAVEDFAAPLKNFKNDPLLIGYFLANEPQWAFGNQIPAAAMLESGAPSATRSELVRWLKVRYDNNPAALSSVWARQFTSFDSLEQGELRQADTFSDQARKDLQEFSALMVDRCLKPVDEAVRRADPNHLNLGIRWAGMGSDYCYQASRYCDVFTVNMYSILPDSTAIRTVTERTGKPVLIGEYHFGATDRGLPSTGLRGVASQYERGVAYRAFVELGAAMPQMIGAHYFIWNDEPVLGRYDGENFNIGVVDVCNTPYRELVDAMRLTHERIYLVASGQVPPVAERAEQVPRVGF
jgi:hypothetical protein